MNAAPEFCNSCGAPWYQGAPRCSNCGSPPPQVLAPHMMRTQAMASAPPPPQQPLQAQPNATWALDEHDTPRAVAPTRPMAAVPMQQAPQQQRPMANYPVMQQAPPPPAARPEKAYAMTMMAGAALGVSETFNAAFARPFPGWRAELAEPVGPSTGAGKQAQQPITLVSQTGDRVAIGRVDPIQRVVTMRTYGVVSKIHQQRYARAFLVAPGDYDGFIGRVGGFFKVMQFGVVEERYVPTGSTPPAPGSSSSGLGRILWYLLALALVVAFALLIYMQL
jgi:hypothetical protein